MNEEIGEQSTLMAGDGASVSESLLATTRFLLARALWAARGCPYRGCAT